MKRIMCLAFGGLLGSGSLQVCRCGSIAMGLALCVNACLQAGDDVTSEKPCSAAKASNDVAPKVPPAYPSQICPEVELGMDEGLYWYEGRDAERVCNGVRYYEVSSKAKVTQRGCNDVECIEPLDFQKKPQEQVQQRYRTASPPPLRAITNTKWRVLPD